MNSYTEEHIRIPTYAVNRKLQSLMPYRGIVTSQKKAAALSSGGEFKAHHGGLPVNAKGDIVDADGRVMNSAYHRTGLNVVIHRVTDKAIIKTNKIEPYSDSFLKLCLKCPLGLAQSCEAKIRNIEDYRYFRVKSVKGEIAVYPENAVPRPPLPGNIFKYFRLFNASCGHLVAASFGAPDCPFNMVPMGRNTNVNPYKRIEDTLRKNLRITDGNARTGQKINRGTIEVDVTYDTDDSRFSFPVSFYIKITIKDQGRAAPHLNRHGKETAKGNILPELIIMDSVINLGVGYGYYARERLDKDFVKDFGEMLNSQEKAGQAGIKHSPEVVLGRGGSQILGKA